MYRNYLPLIPSFLFCCSFSPSLSLSIFFRPSNIRSTSEQFLFVSTSFDLVQKLFLHNIFWLSNDECACVCVLPHLQCRANQSHWPIRIWHFAQQDRKKIFVRCAICVRTHIFFALALLFSFSTFVSIARRFTCPSAETIHIYCIYVYIAILPRQGFWYPK